MGSVRAAIAGRFVLALAIGALMTLPVSAMVSHGPATDFGSFSQAVENPLFEQYDACTGGGPASQQFPDFGDAVLQAADDFNVSGTHTLAQVIALGSFSAVGPMGPVTIEIYDQDGPGGLPGTLLCSETGLVSTGADAVVDVALDGTCELGSGLYWLSVLPVMSFAEFGQWFWSSNENGFGSEFAFQDPDQLVGNPCVTWGLGITDCGNGANFPNLCFGIGEEGGDGGGGGVPAVGTPGAIAMLLIVMAISFFYLRRRRTA